MSDQSIPEKLHKKEKAISTIQVDRSFPENLPNREMDQSFPENQTNRMFRTEARVGFGMRVT